MHGRAGQAAPGWHRLAQDRLAQGGMQSAAPRAPLPPLLASSLPPNQPPNQPPASPPPAPRCPAPPCPQIPHYNLQKATAAVKPVMGPYYREPEPSPGPIPTHLWEPLKRSFDQDHFVADEGDIVFYEKDPTLKLKM